MMETFARFGAALVMLVACNGQQRAPADTGPMDAGADASLSDEDIDRIFDRALTFMESSGDIIERNASDCPEMGRELEAFRGKNAALIRQVQHLYGRSPPDRRKEFDARYRDRYHAAWAKIRPGLQNCKNVPEVSRVIRELAGE